uniref:Uncharacterized protein n=1 Tax=Anguilla anguilla TaxID=7936 RepID=A0A0E9TNR9_ANGAN
MGGFAENSISEELRFSPGELPEEFLQTVLYQSQSDLREQCALFGGRSVLVSSSSLSYRHSS